MNLSASAEAEYFSNRPPAPGQLALSGPAPGESAGGAKGAEFQPFGEDGFTFLDFLDIINPLQNIPVVSTLYRSLTGDTIDPASRLGGGALFGGPIGAILSLVNIVVNEGTGKDIGENVLALFDEPAGQDGDGGPPTEIAQAPGFIHEASYEQPPDADAAPVIQSNIEVLQWAQQEAAYRRDALVQAGLPVETAQYSAVKKYAAGAALSRSAALAAVNRDY